MEFAAHEVTHSEQYANLGGIINFGIVYAIAGAAEAMLVPVSESIQATYQRNDLEILARRNAKAIVKDLKKKGKSTCTIELGNIATVSSEGH